jgi:hypothetical protein
MKDRMEEINKQWTSAMNLNNVIRNNLPPEFPEIVTLCGSTRFMDAYTKEMRRLTLEGKIVISVGLFGHQEGLDMASETKVMLDELHKRKIDLSDRIHVINPRVWVCYVCKKPCGECPSYDRPSQCCGAKMGERSGYIGSSTRSEIEYATANGKQITYMEPIENQSV